MKHFPLFGPSLFLGILGLLVGPHAVGQKQITNPDIWYSSMFSSERVDGGTSMKDGVHYTAQEEDGGAAVVNVYEYATGNKTGVLLNSKDLLPTGVKEPIAMDGYSLSGDEKLVMVETGSEPLYRHSYYAHNYIYDRSTKAVRPLSDLSKSKQRLATFSPDGTHAAFVRDNNLFVVDLATMKEQQVTRDGEWNKVINGAPDWVYEEEFEFTQAYAWSPNGRRLLYLRSDESEVKEFDFTTYEEQLYPSSYKFKYPKAGEANSKVSLHVYEVFGGATTDVPLGKADEDAYLPRFGFVNDDAVWFMQMNRLQNEKLIYAVDMPVLRAVQAGLKPRQLYSETSPTYIECTDDLHFLADGSGFVLTNESSGWNHIQWCSMDGKQQRAITAGNYDVTAVIGVDDANKRVIFSASKRKAAEEEVYAVGLNGKGLKQLSPVGGNNDAEFSEGFKYFINTRSTANEPPTITLHDGQGKLVKVLKDNAKLKEKLKEYALTPKEFIRIPIGKDTLNAWIIKPPQFDSRQRYPVFMTQYSGPNSNSVLDQWGGRDLMWHEMLAQRGYIVLCADGRGTGRRGRDWRHLTYGQLGKYETEDQIAVARWLQAQPWVDGKRIGIQGWSYGGYMSSLCITKGADVFKAAIAVAPVTNWRYYDSIYTERYMGLPKDNAAGYDDNSPINHVDKLKGSFLLVHGLADDNVHFQNSAEMITSLVKANKPFDLAVYPDKNHGIYGGTTRLHLFQKMTDFLLTNL